MRTATAVVCLCLSAAARAGEPAAGQERDFAIYYEAKRGDQKIYLVPASRRALDQLGEYSQAKDGEGIERLIKAGRVFVYTEPRVKVRVLSVDRDGVIVKFRLLAAGEAGAGLAEEGYGFTMNFPAK
jgi:hypothetical protein